MLSVLGLRKVLKKNLSHLLKYQLERTSYKKGFLLQTSTRFFLLQKVYTYTVQHTKITRRCKINIFAFISLLTSQRIVIYLDVVFKLLNHFYISEYLNQIILIR